MKTLFKFLSCIIPAALPLLAFSAPDWQAEGESVMDGYGFCTASAGDINNDGFDDFLVTAPFYETDLTMHGRLYLYRGGPKGIESAPTVLDGLLDKQQFGYSACSAGDVNGDGFDDILVGAPGTTDSIDGQGAALLYQGGPDGISTTPAWTAFGDVEHCGFGSSVAGIGDVNGDGYNDVLVGAPYHTHDKNVNGLVRLYLGSATGLSKEPAWEYSGNSRSYLGWALAGGRDINGDGYPDFAVAAPNDSRDDSGYSSKILIFSGGKEPGALIQTIHTPLRNQRWGGNGIALADINGDKDIDLVFMPLEFKDRGQLSQPVAVCFGTGKRLQAPETINIWPRTNLEHYRPVFQCLDLNSDGADEIIIGNAFATLPEEDQGALILIRGSASRNYEEKIRIFTGDLPGGWLGETVAAAGDVNGDGKTDLLVGGRIPEENYQRGKVMLWQHPGGLAWSSPDKITHPPQSEEPFEAWYRRVKDDRLDRHMIDEPWRELLKMTPKILSHNVGFSLNYSSSCHWMLGYLEQQHGGIDMASRHYKHAECFMAREWRTTSSKWHRSADLACLINNRYENLISQGRIAAAGPVVLEAIRIQNQCDAEGPEKNVWNSRQDLYRLFGYSIHGSFADQLWNEGEYTKALNLLDRKLSATKQDDTPTSTHNLAAAYAKRLSFLGDHPKAMSILQDTMAYEPDPHYTETRHTTSVLLQTITARHSGFRNELLQAAEVDSAALLGFEDKEGYLESRLCIAELLYLGGRHEASIEELNKLINAAAEHFYMILETSALELRARNHLALGNIEQAARDCRRALLKFRHMGLKYREPDLYDLYAECEQALGRLEQASNTWNTADELSLQLGLSNLWKSNGKNRVRTSTETAVDQGISGGNTSKDPTDTNPEDAVAVGIVPTLMTTEVSAGETARTRFLIGNLSEAEVTGKLIITTDGNLEVKADLPLIQLVPVEGSTTASTSTPVDMQLPPLGTTTVYLECAAPEKLHGSEVALSWQGADARAGWICAPLPDGTPQRKIIHAGLINDNPFECAVFYHELRPAAEGNIPRNLRAVASAPCRIEFVDLASGTFLAADHNGDGDFNDSGDLIWQDLDHDLYPDLPADMMREIEVRAYPAGPLQNKPLIIKVGQKLGEGVWADEVVDILKAES